MTHLLKKETPFIFSKECIEAFETLKIKLTQTPILVAPDWDLPFEIMCDASDFAVGAVLGQLYTDPLGSSINLLDESRVLSQDCSVDFAAPKNLMLDFPDCEDSHARSIHMSFTSSASFWESRAAALSNEWGFCLLKRSNRVWIVTGGGFSPEPLDGPIPSRNSS
ncbi:reverse transcriptase domain-containing protein [Tanacetum coccineum]